VLIVEFPNCESAINHKSFKWIPTYKQLDDIKRGLEEVEKESWLGFVSETMEQVKKEIKK